MYVPEHRPEGTYWSHRLLLVANDLRESYGERSATGGNRTYILVRYALHTAAFCDATLPIVLRHMLTRTKRGIRLPGC